MPERGTTHSFTRLLAHAREGDPEARRSLFERIAGEDHEGALVLAMARRLLPADDRLRDFIESRDLVQSALRSGWVDLADFRGESPAEFLAWIRSILRRKLAQMVRRRRPRPVGSAAEQRAGGVEAAPEEPLATLVRKEVVGHVRAALDGLPRDQRAVLELRLAGMKSPEIADRLGLTPEAVRKRESRAAGRLRDLLKGEFSPSEA